MASADSARCAGHTSDRQSVRQSDADQSRLATAEMIAGNGAHSNENQSKRPDEFSDEGFTIHISPLLASIMEGCPAKLFHLTMIILFVNKKKIVKGAKIYFVL